MFLTFSGFDWDSGNRDKSFKKHEVTCEKAEEVFYRKPFVYLDEKHSTESEKRHILFGETSEGKALLVSFTIRNEKVRVISARPMSRKERKWYDEEKKKTPF